MRKKTSWLNEAFTWSLKHDGESKGKKISWNQKSIAHIKALSFGIARKKNQKQKLSYYFPLAAINRVPNLGT